ncbi:probable crossover junction endonuclease EME2 isoform X1 [Monodelphis domestica]|uniref:probable crossover junction endonuclease EME2 isoform X1 n=1 Tax=Monodelphis domestica TaxID=13616 RepID=UPI0024E243E9|nr:probable crossover junction endonuclease EME2 isoform X1 [Monodelphis domestica]
MEVGTRGTSGRGRSRQPPGRRPVTWEISDSEPESPSSYRAEGLGDPGEASAESKDPGGLDPPVGPVAAPGQARPRERVGRKAQEKMGTAAARAEARRKDRELERQKRKSAAEALRLMRPDRCLMHLTVLLDPALLENAGSDILIEALVSLKCEYVIEPQPWVQSLTWKRSVPTICQSSAAPASLWVAEVQEVLVVLEPEEFLKGLISLAQGCPTACSVPWIVLENAAGQTHYHLAVIGLDDYQWFSQSGVKEFQQESGGMASNSKVAMTQQEIEEALVLLQLHKNLAVLFLHSWQEFSQHVCALTKAIAQRPYKQYMETQAFSFCTSGRWAGGEGVAQDGKGLREAWRRQIQQFNRVSPSMADAVITAFPSPNLLRQAYAVCTTEQERLSLLSDIAVKKDDQIQVRRVGPDLSRRVYLFLTSTNPDLLLDLGI